MERVHGPVVGDLPRVRGPDGGEVQQDRPVPRLLASTPSARRPGRWTAGPRRRPSRPSTVPQVRQAADAPREQARAVPVLLGLPDVQGVVQPRRRRATPSPRSSRPSTSARSAASRWPCGKARGALPRLHGLPQVPQHDARRRPGEARPAGQGRRQVREVRRPDGRQAGPPRAVPRLPELSQVPEHRADPRRPQGAARRAGRPPPAALDAATTSRRSPSRRSATTAAAR